MTPGARRLSAAGGGALCVFRVERAALAVELELRDARDRALAWPPPGRWRVGRLLHAGRLVDEVVVLGRATSLEIHGHGAPAVTAALAAALGADAHADSASPGDKLHVGASRVASSRATDAPAHDDEPAVANAARSLRGARALASALDGPLADLLRALRGGELSAARAAELQRAAALLDFGERLGRPACVRLVGRPNAGKSTLFNRLAGGPRALVSERAGTTRDTVTHELLVAGVPVRLEDAAGVESAGRPAKGAGRGGADAPAGATDPGADLCVHLLSEPDEEPLRSDAPCLRVLGRADLRAGSVAAAELAVSGLTGLGCEALLGRVARILGLDRPAADDLWAAVRGADRALVRAARGR